MTGSAGKALRWGSLIAICLLSVATIVFFLARHDAEGGTRQVLVMKVMGAGVSGLAFSILWILAFSRMKVKRRLGMLGVIVALLCAFWGLFRFGGFTGDLVPIFTWRWTGGIAEAPESAGETDFGLARDYPQFLGPRRNATVSEVVLAKDWPVSPPELLWRRPIGEAWSGFAVSGARAVTQEQIGEYEAVSCYGLLSGDLLWQKRNKARYDDPLGGVGPRATPAVDGDRVYTVGATGFFACRSLETGELQFGFNLLERHKASLPDWGVAGSPLVFGDLVILSAGGQDGNSLVAYQKVTGELVWRGGNDHAHWSSPVVYDVEGEPQVLIFNKGGVAAHSVESGAVLWEFHWTRSTGTPRVALPVALPGSQFVISSGYGAGAAMFQVLRNGSGFVAEEIWRSLHLKSKFNNFVSRDGFIFGLDDGVLTCIDVETGRRTWKKGRYGHGQLLLGNDWLLLMAENGEAVLLEPNPEEPIVLGSFQALKGKSWNPPALAGPFLLVRNHLQAACYRLPTRAPYLPAQRPLSQGLRPEVAQQWQALQINDRHRDEKEGRAYEQNTR